MRCTGAGRNCGGNGKGEKSVNTKQMKEKGKLQVRCQKKEHDERKTYNLTGGGP